MNERNKPSKVVVLGWLYLVTTGFLAAIGLSWYLALELFSATLSNGTIQGFLAFTERLGVSFFLIMALPSLVAGLALLQRRSWSRPFALAVAVFSLVNFPLGTAVGLYTFWVLAVSDDSSDSTLKTA